MDAEHGSEKQKSPEKKKSLEKSPEKIEEEDVDTQEEMKEVVKEPGAKRKKSVPRKSTRKRQKIEEATKKEDLCFEKRLVKERYSASRPEGYDLMLWGDLHTLFEPDEEDELWKSDKKWI
ncbi:hypothetical protein Tco_0182308, partial [Tanacetum coccineum]